MIKPVRAMRQQVEINSIPEQLQVPLNSVVELFTIFRLFFLYLSCPRSPFFLTKWHASPWLTISSGFLFHSTRVSVCRGEGRAKCRSTDDVFILQITLLGIRCCGFPPKLQVHLVLSRAGSYCFTTTAADKLFHGQILL